MLERSAIDIRNGSCAAAVYLGRQVLVAHAALIALRELHAPVFALPGHAGGVPPAVVQASGGVGEPRVRVHRHHVVVLPQGRHPRPTGHLGAAGIPTGEVGDVDGGRQPAPGGLGGLRRQAQVEAGRTHLAQVARRVEHRIDRQRAVGLAAEQVGVERGVVLDEGDGAVADDVVDLRLPVIDRGRHAAHRLEGQTEREAAALLGAHVGIAGHLADLEPVVQVAHLLQGVAPGRRIHPVDLRAKHRVVEGVHGRALGLLAVDLGQRGGPV
ncbi:MAG: hypothetical protein ACK56I_19935, partial [bacterium]